jgi:hypothetical protein
MLKQDNVRGSMKNRSVYAGALVALIALGISGPTASPEAAEAAPAVKTIVLKTMSVTISFPSSLKITPRRCGEFRVKYSVNTTSAVRATIVIKDERGDWLGYQVINRFSELRRQWDPTKGTKYFEYCKVDWIDDFGDDWAGVEPGWAHVELTEGSHNTVTKKGRFLFRK